MSAAAVTLTLKYKERTVGTFTLAKGDEGVLIGRSHDDCRLLVPSEDQTASRKHARVFWKRRALWGSALYIEDAGSSRGVHLGRRKIAKPAKVVFGAPYLIGECLLEITRPNGGGKKKAFVPQLEYLNGDLCEKVVEIKAADGRDEFEFTIGKASSNDIVLNDETVSRQHAQVKVKPPEKPGRPPVCMIEDLGSRNGTFVNGEKKKLAPGRPRLLRDKETISIAGFEFCFHNRPWPKPPKIGRILGVIFLTLGLLTAGYEVYRKMNRDQLGTFLVLAQKYAAAERFAEAKEWAKKALDAADNAATRLRCNSYCEQLEKQEKTFTVWTAAQTALREGGIGKARAGLNQLCGPNARVDWRWNPETAQKTEGDAAFCHAFFAVLGQPSEELPRVRRPQLDERIAQIERYRKENAARLAELDYLTNAVKRLEGFLADLKQVQEGIRAIDQAIETVRISDDRPPDFTAAVERLEKVVGEAKLPNGVRAHAGDLLPIARKYLAARAFLEEELSLIRDLKFAEVNRNRERMPLPTVEEAARHARFSDARDCYLRIHVAYQHEVAVLAPMVRNLDAYGIRNDEKGKVMATVCDAAKWTKALGFDCFAGDIPLASREAPKSSYDELLGIEATYEGLHALVTAEAIQRSGAGRSGLMNFEPVCQRARAAFEQVRTFRQAVGREDAAAYRSGQLGRLYALAAEIMADREGLIARLRQRAGKLGAGAPVDRAQLVAGYYAEYFADEDNYATLRALGAAFDRLQKQITKLDEDYEQQGDPEKQLALRKEILAKGIPGMLAVRKRWAEASD